MKAWGSRQVALATVAVWLAAIALLWLLMPRDMNMFDEGLVLTNAMRTAAGDVVHRDYYSPYAPGAYYIVSWLFAVATNQFLAARLYGVIVNATIVALVFMLLARRVNVAACLLFTALVGAWIVGSPYQLYSIYPCLLFGLAGSAILLGPGGRERPGRLLLAGAVTSLAALFRYDGGFFLLASHAIAILILAPREAWARRDGIAILRPPSLYAAGAVAALLPFAVAFLSVAPVGAFVNDIVDYPLHYYPRMRSLPFPGLSETLHSPSLIGIYFPIAAVAACTAHLIARRRRTASPAGQQPADMAGDAFLTVFTLLAAILYYKGLVRVSSLHMVLSIVPALVASAMLVDRWWPSGALRRFGAVALAMIAFVPAASDAGHELRTDIRVRTRTMLGYHLFGSPPQSASPLCATPPALASASLAPEYLAIGNFVRLNSRPAEPIFVGLNRHDRIYANPVTLYFTTGRLPPTHWHQFDPGLQTRADIQTQMIADLRRDHVRWVIRDATYDTINEPNESSRSSGVFLLDRFLAGTYHLAAKAGPVEAWLANGSPAPAIAMPAMQCRAS